MKHYLLIAPALALACDTYDPPPTARIVQPAQGTWDSSKPIEFTFSEPIDLSLIHI